MGFEDRSQPLRLSIPATGARAGLFCADESLGAVGLLPAVDGEEDREHERQDPYGEDSEDDFENKRQYDKDYRRQSQNLLRAEVQVAQPEEQVQDRRHYRALARILVG